MKHLEREKLARVSALGLFIRIQGVVRTESEKNTVSELVRRERAACLI
jgi:hypothetical protein